MLARRVTQGLRVAEVGGGKEEELGHIGMDGCGKGQAHSLGATSNMQSEQGCLFIWLSPASFT